MSESNVWLDDVLLQDLGLIITLDSDEPLLPPTRDRTIVIPGIHGARDMGAYMQPRPLALQCTYKGLTGHTELKQKAELLIKLLINPDGTPRTVKIRFGDEPEKWMSVRYSGSIPLSRLLRGAQFRLPFIAYDPYKYAEFNAYGDNINGFTFNVSGQSVVLKNSSYLETSLIITMTGAFANVKITHLESRKWIQINETTAANETIVIDSKTFTVYKYVLEEDTLFLSPSFPAQFETQTGKTNLLSKYTGDFFNLIPGDNTLYFEAPDIGADVKFHWYHKFL